jgi:N-acylneuraminate cytidylyltransferase
MRVAIIPARGGSCRIPRKNIRDFHGKPIMAYSIDTAKASGLFDGGIFVSTEDEEIAKIARSLGAGLIHRPPELAEVNGTPDPGTQEVTRHAITVMQDLGDKVDYACCIYATAPLMRPYYLRLGYQVLTRNPKADFAYSVDGETQRDAAQFYWGHARAFLERRPFNVKDPTLENVWKIALPSAEVCDINTEEDWERAERHYATLRVEGML